MTKTEIEHAVVWRDAWPVLVFIAGMDLALFYRLP